MPILQINKRYIPRNHRIYSETNTSITLHPFFSSFSFVKEQSQEEISLYNHKRIPLATISNTKPATDLSLKQICHYEIEEVKNGYGKSLVGHSGKLRTEEKGPEKQPLMRENLT